MPTVKHALELYQQLADWYEQRGQAQMRDRFLVLAADAALVSGNPDMAERLRVRLLQQNPHHLLKPYASFNEAMKAPDVQSYVGDLRRSYSPETAEHLLESLRSQAGEAPPAAAPPRPMVSQQAPAVPQPVKETPEVLQFYRIHQELGETAPDPVAARQVPVTRPLPRPTGPLNPPAQAPRKAATNPPAPKVAEKKTPRSPTVSPFANEPILPAATRGSTRDEQDLATGFWVSSTLFVVVLLAGLALAAYTLAQPFLPAEWFK